MAVKKKEDSRTIEDKLKTALVPEDQQPYPIPENWVWTRMGDITRIIGGGTPRSHDPSLYEDGTIPWIRPVDLSGYDDMYISQGSRNITKAGLNSSSARMIPKDSLLFSSRAPIGYVAIAANDATTSQGFKSFLPTSALVPQYGYWYLKAAKPLAEALASGTTFQEISGAKAALIPIPLPPLPEQQRIAEKLESLLGKIKEAKAALDEIPEILQNFRQTVLAAACSGRLTEDWRKANLNIVPSNKLLSLVLNEQREKWCDTELAKLRDKGNEPKDDKWRKRYKKPAVPEITNLPELPHTWSWSNIQQLAEAQPNAIKAGPFGSTLKKIYYVAKGYKIYGQEQVIRDDPYYGDYYIDENRFKELASCSVKPGDILVSLVGTIGRVLILPQDIEPGIINPRLVKLSLDNRLINPLFIKYYLQSPSVKNLFSFASHGGTMDILNLSLLKNIPIPLPPIPEQQEIVRRVEALFTKADDLELQYKDAMELIESLPEIILSKAFRGELVPQDPNDEPAIKLLERISRKGTVAETGKVNKRKQHE